mmetsp:Transcript_65555/g.207326  ORF Transcript_65555/g.207326 Transcript_65555/m.207326 type:complete len:308 (+) Transcript_65555:161-1084(+)|eukprot:CAMPEP_0182860020 /NCGR_PEP_ID=MMETSP0034_2-20130328/4668_1 /TAXON_ID=156128 /ORGANISM="Nephroselmis pyriformis, Strain CCMP717" /LENGTH=307 /DNA_ID=CAMNT_0024991747 /DNA_START=132 /DNA_END=1055 /DNA_ORIENTATION=-
MALAKEGGANGGFDVVAPSKRDAAECAGEKEEEDLEEFREILGTEGRVDMKRLRTLCMHGVPASMRGLVWKYLLGVSKADQNEDITSSRQMHDDYLELFGEGGDLAGDGLDSDVVKRIRGEVKRYRAENAFFSSDKTRSLMEKTIHVFLRQNSYVEYQPFMVHLLGPLLFCIRDEDRDVYYCFRALMNATGPTLGEDGASQAVAPLMTMLRNLQPELYSHFEDEELDASAWAYPWLQSLSCRELPLECVLRLWDVYFSCEEGLDLHPYVCLAILELFSDELTELDSTEVEAFLRRLPAPDMDQVDFT